MNADEKLAVSITLEPDLLDKIDARAKELDLNRSQFIRRLAREEFTKNPLPEKQLELSEKAA